MIYLDDFYDCIVSEEWICMTSIRLLLSQTQNQMIANKLYFVVALLANIGGVFFTSYFCHISTIILWAWVGCHFIRLLLLIPVTNKSAKKLNSSPFVSTLFWTSRFLDDCLLLCSSDRFWASAHCLMNTCILARKWKLLIPKKIIALEFMWLWHCILESRLTCLQ